MERPYFLRNATLGIALSALAGCAEHSNLPVAAAPEPATATQHRAAQAWMLPEAKSEDLIYASRGCGGSCVISYPAMKLVGTIPSSGEPPCTDAQGNIFIPSDYQVVEYAHGGTQPIAKLSVPSELVGGCAVDPTTNDLAVIAPGEVFIYPDEQGTPTTVSSHIDSEFGGYDAKGDLFVDGINGQNYGFAELPKGASDFIVLSISDSVGRPGAVQWDGKYITYENTEHYVTISQLTVTGSSAAIAGTTRFSIPHSSANSWIYKAKVLMPYNNRGEFAKTVGLFAYPKGGKPKATISKYPGYAQRDIAFTGVAVSVAPSRARPRKKGVQK